MTTPGTPLSLIEEAFAAGYAAADARQAPGEPMGGAVPLDPGSPPDSQPWVPEPPGDGGGVT